MMLATGASRMPVATHVCYTLHCQRANYNIEYTTVQTHQFVCVGKAPRGVSSVVTTLNLI